MSITIKLENDGIEEALRDYVEKLGMKMEGKTATIKLTAGRGEGKGHSAEVTISDTEQKQTEVPAAVTETETPVKEEQPVAEESENSEPATVGLFNKPE